MTHRPSDFKPSQVYDWELEPQNERPSEFAQSTGYQLHSGFYAAPVVSARRPSGNGLMIWLTAGGVASLAVVGLLVLVRLLRG